MNLIAICVCTYDRIAGLRALFDGIDKQRFIRLTDERICVIVVDNSTTASASDICNAYARRGRFQLRFVHERRKGLSFARNAALSAALEVSASLIAFIDDDELPEPAWLELLVEKIEVTGVAAAVGPVYPIFEVKPPRWVPVHAYSATPRSKAGFVEVGHTGNSVLDASVIEALGLCFEARFNDTGGEDTIFFKRLRDKGLKIAFAHNAVVHELVPRGRMSLRWLWLRWYRTGAIEAHLRSADPDRAKGRLVNIARGFARVSAGSLRIIGAALTFGWWRPAALVSSSYTFCRGAGLIASALGQHYREYAAQPRHDNRASCG